MGRVASQVEKGTFDARCNSSFPQRIISPLVHSLPVLCNYSGGLGSCGITAQFGRVVA